MVMLCSHTRHKLTPALCLALEPHSQESGDQQDTKEYLNQRGTKIGVFRESKMGGKGEGEEVKSGRKVNRA